MAKQNEATKKKEEEEIRQKEKRACSIAAVIDGEDMTLAPYKGSS